VYADHLRSKATVRGNAAMLRFMISGMLWTYTHTSTNDVKTFNLELLKYVYGTVNK